MPYFTFIVCPYDRAHIEQTRQKPDIQGVRLGDHTYKVSEYADDLLFSMSNPHVLLPNLMKEFGSYGNLSNLKINNFKSEAMGVELPPMSRDIIQPNFNFKWVSTALKYLGTYIPSK